MKLVQINAICDGSSTGRICRELNDALLERGHEGLIIYGNGHSEYAHARKVSGKYGVKLHGLMSRIFGKNAAYSPFATRKVIRLLKAYQPDVVHLQNIHGNFVNLKPLLKYLAKADIPTAVTLHDCWFFTGKCTHYTEQGCYKWQTGCHNCPKLKADIPSFALDRTAQMWKEKNCLFQAIPRLGVIGVSDWITGEGKKAPCFSNAKQIRRIYNWIDTESFSPRESNIRQKLGIAEDQFMILCIGAGWARNTSRSRELLKLAGILDPAYTIVLAGSVDFADELPDNIRYIGYVHSVDELAQLYSAADVYVHMSREDTFGKVIAEAMACGTPAVVYDSTACPELVREGCGYAVPAGDTQALKAAIDQIRQNGKETFSAQCRVSVEPRFLKTSIIDETIAFYQALQEM